MLESTLVLCKPDAVQRRLVGEIISRIERKGLRIIAMKMIVINQGIAEQHYAEHVGKDFYPALESFITSGPSIAMIVEGVWAIDVMRRMAGRTDARFADPGTIRGDFGVSTRMNLIHTSDLSDSAKREIKLFFPEGHFKYYNPLLPWTCSGEEEKEYGSQS